MKEATVDGDDDDEVDDELDENDELESAFIDVAVAVDGVVVFVVVVGGEAAGAAVVVVRVVVVVVDEGEDEGIKFVLLIAAFS